MTTVEEIVQRLEAVEARLVTAEKSRRPSTSETSTAALYLETMERCRKLELGLLGRNHRDLDQRRSRDGRPDRARASHARARTRSSATFAVNLAHGMLGSAV